LQLFPLYFPAPVCATPYGYRGITLRRHAHVSKKKRHHRKGYHSNYFKHKKQVLGHKIKLFLKKQRLYHKNGILNSSRKIVSLHKVGIQK